MIPGRMRPRGGVQSTPATTAKAFEIALSRGVLLRPIGNTVYFMPPYVIGEPEFAMLVDAAEAIVEELAT